MHFKDKSGKEVGGKEFIMRWKQGMQAVTPLQQTKVMLINYIIVLIGIIWGIIFTSYMHTYWLTVILIGSFGITGLQFFGNLQKYNILKEMENMIQINEREVMA